MVVRVALVSPSVRHIGIFCILTVVVVVVIAIRYSS
jgi:hypothetical protein